MVEIDWKKFMRIRPDKLTEREKDDLQETVTSFIPDFNLERKYLIHFLRIAQEVLKFKSEQVELLTNELDEIAAEQGKEEGNKFNQYIDEIEQLREKLEYYQRIDKNSGRSAYASDEELKREMVKLEIQNDELLKEIKEKEKELLHEKEEVEKYAEQVATLEREKQELARELKVLQDEATEKTNRSLRDSLEFGSEKYEELTETIRQKNKHISQLLEDIEIIEEENLSLRTKLTNVRDELLETTTHITEITAELSKLRLLNEEYEKKNVESEDKIKSLMIQIEELVEEKSKYDKQVDEYVLIFNTKLQEWKEALEAKDEEIFSLKAEVEKLSSPAMFVSSESGETKLHMKIAQQEKEIRILQNELQKATMEINSSTEIIEKLKERQMKIISVPQQNQSMVTILEEKIKILEEKVTCAEEDAIARSEEITDLIMQLREYESGTFGLSEAVKKIKKLEKHLQQKDLQIEKLVEICNNLEIKLDCFEEQNMTLRERLGLSVSDEIDTSGIKLKYRKDEEMLENLKLQLDRKEEELVKVKLKYRKVVTFLKSCSPSMLKSPEKNVGVKSLCKEEEKELRKKLEVIIKENDALRKGMHEILESIRNQNCSGAIEVESVCLKRLLEALDSRHVSGWYHPAMRLQAQLSTEEGKNEELRHQIRSLKTEEKKKVTELQNAYLKIQSLESDLTQSRPEVEEKQKEEELVITTEVVEDRNKKLTVLEQKIVQLESELLNLKVLLNQKKTEIEKLKENTAVEKENLLSKITKLEALVSEYKNSSDPDTEKIPELTSQVAVLERKVNYLKNLEVTCREDNEILKQKIIEEEEVILKDVLKLQNEKSQLLDKIDKLETEILNSIPKDKYNALNEELANLTAKYQYTISVNSVKEESNNIEKLEADINSLQNEKDEILKELTLAKEKLIVAEGLISEEVVTKGDFSNEMSRLANKLAASEVREITEKQKSEHLTKLNDILKLQQEEVENRNKELVEQVKRLMEDIEKHQVMERALRMKASDRTSEEDQSVLIGKIENLEKTCKELTTEKDNFQELLEISQGQCRAFQEWKDRDKILLSSLNEQILILQSTNKDKAAFSRVSHELAMAKLEVSHLSKKNNDLKMKVTKLLAQNVGLEMKLTENNRHFFNEKKKHLALTQFLFEAMDEVRRLYGGAVRFTDIEDIFKTKAALKELKKEFLEKAKEVKYEIYQYSVKKEEMEMQLESLEDLKSGLKGDTKNLIFWHNKSTELRLKEAKCRRENELLTGEVFQLDAGLKKLSEEISAMEEENVKKEKEWENKQKLWESSQLQMLHLLKEKGVKKSQREFGTNTEIIETKESKVEEQQKLAMFECKVQELEVYINKLKKEGEEKDEIIIMKEKLLNNINRKSKTIELEEAITREKIENAEKEALNVTIDSLEQIIKQKEETIIRYQNLLKEGREEYSKACAKFKEEVKGLNETIVAQGKAYSKLKSTVQTNNMTNENIPAVVEKYMTKIQELEEELGEFQNNLSRSNIRLHGVQQEVDKWRSLAEERLLMVEDTRERMEAQHKDEVEKYKEEIKQYQKEIDKLNQSIESIRNENNKGNSTEGILLKTIQQLQVQLLEHEPDHLPAKSDQLSDCTFDKPQRYRSGQLNREIETLKRQLKFSRDESARLREQVRLLQCRPIKRSKTSGSTTTRSDSRLNNKEESLTSKIKHLEELLSVSKEKEKELLEINHKKLKSIEEVARWDERKKSQQTIQQLTTKLKEKEAEVEVLQNKNESFRNMVYKCERDKSILESQLKAAKEGSGGFNARIEKLTVEKNQLEAEVEALRNKLEDQLRHSGGLGAALLQDKLEEQERKLAAYELSAMGHTAVVEELEKFKTILSNLEKLNLKLESENLSLKLKLEKEKADTKYLQEKVKHFQEAAEEMKRQDSDREILKLQKTIQRLTEENKKLRRPQKECKNTNATEKVRTELAKLKEDHKLLRIKYMETVDKNIALEKEVKSYRYQIHLMEEKELAEVLTRANTCPSVEELSQELISVKAKLAHKTHLLSRVKTLLVKAAAKEKALHQEVCFLQNQVPQIPFQTQS